MGDLSPYLRLLASVPAFAALGTAELHALYRFCALRVLAKGDAASIAGEAVEELAIVVSGRLIRPEHKEQETGPGGAVEMRAFITRCPAAATAIALRETVLLTLAFDDLMSAVQASRELLAALLAQLGPQGREDERQPRPARLARPLRRHGRFRRQR